jgi:hypothetical protein
LTCRATQVDQDTGRPVPQAQFEVTLVGRKRPEPYGFFEADEKGEALVDLPPERLRRLVIQVSAEGYPPSAMLWDLERGERIPTNHIFKIARKKP